MEAIHSDDEDWGVVDMGGNGESGRAKDDESDVVFGVITTSCSGKAADEALANTASVNPFSRSGGAAGSSGRGRLHARSSGSSSVYARKMFVGGASASGARKRMGGVLAALQDEVDVIVCDDRRGALLGAGGAGKKVCGGSFLGKEAVGGATNVTKAGTVATSVAGTVATGARRVELTGGWVKESASGIGRIASREDGSHVISLRRGVGAGAAGAAEEKTNEKTNEKTEEKTKEKTKATTTTTKPAAAGWGNNFVRLNMKKGGKDFARVKGAGRFKKRKGGRGRWKVDPLRAVGDGEEYLSGWEQGGGRRCYRCGQTGHFAAACTNVAIEVGDAEGADDDDDGDREATAAVGRAFATTAAPSTAPSTAQATATAATAATTFVGPIVSLPSADMSDDTALCAALSDLLEDKFGHAAFRGSQLATITNILNGKSCLNIMPTGMGKSLCYQLPAFFLSRPVIVISPLIALMQDQCAAAPKELNAAVLWSGQTPKEALEILDNLRQGITRLLFISPERASNEIFLDAVRPWLPLELLVIDEAHCISEWGHSFRPSYYRLGKVIRSHLPSQSILALTATATLTTEACIRQILDIPAENTFRHKGMHPNLRLKVVRMSDSDSSASDSRKWEVIAGKVLPKLKQKTCRRAILYCSFRRDADTLARMLVVGGVRAKSYHSGVFVAERERILTSFAKGTLNVVVATTAFGMGINIAHVDAVYHVSMPRSLEEYVQQIGRAGRSGDVAECLCFPSKSDFLTLRSLASNPYVRPDAVKTIVDAIFPSSLSSSSAAAASLPTEGTYRVLDLRKILEGKIPEETIESIICYMENMETPLLHFVGQVPLKARVSFYAKEAHEMAEEEPLVASILKACPKPRQGVYHVEVAKLCTENGQSPATNFRGLSALSKRRLIGFQNSKERGLCYRIDAKSVKRADVAREVSEWLQNMNSMIIHKLDIAYKAFEVAATTEGDDSAKEDVLRSIVEHYFAEPADDFDAFLEGVVSSSGVESEVVVRGDDGTVSAARLCIRRAKEHNIDVTPVEICGILHGIISGMDTSKGLQQIMRLFWGRLKHVDHRDVLAAAEKAVKDVAEAENSKACVNK